MLYTRKWTIDWTNNALVRGKSEHLWTVEGVLLNTQQTFKVLDKLPSNTR
jgi:hypothetical protein